MNILVKAHKLKDLNTEVTISIDRDDWMKLRHKRNAVIFNGKETCILNLRRGPGSLVVVDQSFPNILISDEDLRAVRQAYR